MTLMSLYSMLRPTTCKKAGVHFAYGGDLVSPVPMISGVGEGLCIRARLSSLSPVMHVDAPVPSCQSTHLHGIPNPLRLFL